jgi:hypothetical protein
MIWSRDFNRSRCDELGLGFEAEVEFEVCVEFEFEGGGGGRDANRTSHNVNRAV